MSVSAPVSPTHGMSSSSAQAWILAAAIITGMVYAFRKVIEPVTPSSTKKSIPAQLLGSGAPPPVTQWVVSYGTAFVILSIIALASPETAGSLSVLIVVGTLLANGQSIVADINTIEGK